MNSLKLTTSLLIGVLIGINHIKPSSPSKQNCCYGKVRAFTTQNSIQIEFVWNNADSIFRVREIGAISVYIVKMVDLQVQIVVVLANAIGIVAIVKVDVDQNARRQVTYTLNLNVHSSMKLDSGSRFQKKTRTKSTNSAGNAIRQREVINGNLYISVHARRMFIII